MTSRRWPWFDHLANKCPPPALQFLTSKLARPVFETRPSGNLEYSGDRICVAILEPCLTSDRKYLWWLSFGELAIGW